MQMLFTRSGLRLSEAQLDQFWRFHQLLRNRQETLDLTRLHNFDSMVLKLYVDSALVATLVDLPSPLLDLGSGGGFPGIPLKIVRPDIRLLLGEARSKRAGFLSEAIRVLGLRDVEVVAHRIGNRFESHVAGVITRAVESMPETLARVSAWLEPGARVLFMKGPESQAEVDAVRADYDGAYRITLDRAYRIPETPHARRLVVVQRLDAPSEPAVPETRLAPAARAAVRAIDAAFGDAEDGSAGETESAEPVESTPVPFGAHRPRELLSDSNATYRDLLSLHKGRGIRKASQALIGGMRQILEILHDFPASCLAWVSAAGPPPPADAPPALQWYRLAPELFQRVDVFGTGSPLLLVRVPELTRWVDADWPPGCTLFVPFQDPENVGAVLRSAAAFGASRAVLLAEAANPFHPRSVRASGGSLLRIPLQSGPSIRDLRVEAAPLVALSTQGRDIGTFEFPPTFGLLPGLEGPGLPEGLRAAVELRIPMAAGVESLNAATAVAITLHCWRQQTGSGDRSSGSPPSGGSLSLFASRRT
jgi:16S rRNA (guanine(527)-N(7))-methyltransferase RsmG